MLTKLPKNNEKGFTLIELMIVIAIIGILAAIAIPQFSAYRVRSFNSAGQADLRNAATAQEAYFVDEQTYCSTVSTLTGSTYGLYLTENVTITIGNAGDESYNMTTYHSIGDASFIIRGPGGSLSKF
jgi:type IV pilus assembly protein PilA